MKTIIALSIATLFFTSTAASAMGLSFKWGQTKKCFDRKSPPLRVTAVPKGTKTLRFKMVDRNAPGYNHGGGKVKWTGKGSIPYGAFRYRGPCPPSPHVYEFTVKAIGAMGEVLAVAKARRKFSK